MAAITLCKGNILVPQDSDTVFAASMLPLQAVMLGPNEPVGKVYWFDAIAATSMQLLLGSYTCFTGTINGVAASGSFLCFTSTAVPGDYAEITCGATDWTFVAVCAVAGGIAVDTPEF